MKYEYAHSIRTLRRFRNPARYMMCRKSQNHHASTPHIWKVGNWAIARFRPMVARSPLFRYRKGRVDLRPTGTGEIYVLEVNASCYLEKTAEFAMAAHAAGIEYDALIGRIVEAALERYGR